MGPTLSPWLRLDGRPNATGAWKSARARSAGKAKVDVGMVGIIKVCGNSAANISRGVDALARGNTMNDSRIYSKTTVKNRSAWKLRSPLTAKRTLR